MNSVQTFLKGKCADCGKEMIIYPYSMPEMMYQRYKEAIAANQPLHCSQCWSIIEMEAENRKYSKEYRCPNPHCIGETSRLEVTDGDEDYVVLRCQWCGESFRKHLDVTNDDYPEPDDCDV